MPAPVRVVVAAAFEQVPVPFQMFLMYALAEALKSAGAAFPSCGTANTKYALGAPTKLGISSPAVAGLGNTTSVPSSLNLNTICGRSTLPAAASVHVETLSTT